LVDDLVVGDRRLADEVARILRVQDHRVDVVAGEGADRVDRVPWRQGDELGVIAVVVPEQPCAEVAGSLAVLGDARSP
jgi:hypothetical protein